MRVLLRKIKYANWEDVTLDTEGDLPADVLGCLKTSGNTLSFWIADLNDPASLDDAFLALVSDFTSPDHGVCILLEYQKLKDMGFDIVCSPENGQTSVDRLKILHHDIKNINLTKLMKLAKFINSELAEQGGKITKFYTKQEFLEFIKTCLDEGKLNPVAVKTKIANELCKILKLKIDPIPVCDCGRKFEDQMDALKKEALINYYSSRQSPSQSDQSALGSG